MAFQIAWSSPPQVIRVASSGPGWLVPIVAVLIGAAAALAAQWVIQIHIVPIVETRKRREDRWERDVRELSDLLTTQLVELARAAYVAQGVFRDLRQLETEARPDVDPRKIAQSREQQARAADQARRAFADLLGTRIKLLTSRVEKINPKAPEIVKFQQAAMRYRGRTLIVLVRPQDDDRTDDAFDEQWEKERDARKALTEQVELLEALPHPPRQG